MNTENITEEITNSEDIKLAQARTYDALIQGNREWVQKELAADPEYFKKLASGQSPDVLWIGCSDSRVPANQVTNTKPGKVFVHRNIANLCVHSDMNMLSVLDYAVNVLQVKHIIVAGHYGCGGVAAAMTTKQYGLIDNWLRNIKDVYRMHAAELDGIAEEDERCDRLVELNVQEQVHNLCGTTIVQNAWKNREDLQIHGWVINLSTGLVNDLNVTSSSSDDLSRVFNLDHV